MPNKRPTHICSYLGLPNDRGSHYGEPSDAHQCYSPSQPGDTALDYQQAFCFSAQYPSCKRFVAPPQADARPAAEVIANQPKGWRVSSKAHRLPESGDDGLRSRPGGIRPEVAMWGLAIILAIVGLYSSFALFVPKNTTSSIAGITSAPFQSVTPTSTPTSTFTPTPVPSEAPTSRPGLAPTLSPLVIPTPPSDGTVLYLLPDADGAGWIASKELAPHWGDRNLHAGAFQSQTYASILQFSLGNVLPPGSKILFAALELTGRSAAHLGKTGEWRLELVDSSQMKDWAQATTDEVINTPALDSAGRPLSPSELGAGVVNRFEFNESQLRLLEQQLKWDRLIFRIKGPAGDEDNLFTWDAGTAGTGGLNAPTLYIIAVPGPFTVITNTPTPANVLTAAANVLRATALARQFGTATPFGPGVVTATPGGGRIEVTPVNPPANAATAAALSAYATAVAITTGTFTPTPKNVVVIYPTTTPILISVDELLVPPTPTPIAGIDYAAIPIPSILNGKILASSNRFGEEYAGKPIVMSADGTVIGVLSTDLYYQAAYAREAYSPDRQRRAIVAPDNLGNERLQIWILDLETGQKNQITHLTRGLAYDPAWSPDGGSIVYVSTETGRPEILVYDIVNQTSRRLTVTTERLVYNQRPSWSPDSKQIVFKSNRDTSHFQIWIINADGSDLRNVSQNPYDELDPVWVKP